MKLNKCPSCGSYTLKEKCGCGKETKPAHYKFLHLRDAPNNFQRKKSRKN